jgi:hypothetical protein
VDRGTCGTAVHLACDTRAMPLGAVVTGANANDGCQTEVLLQRLVVRPPLTARCLASVDGRDVPHVQADGAYGNRPTHERAQRAGFRLHAP